MKWIYFIFLFSTVLYAETKIKKAYIALGANCSGEYHKNIEKFVPFHTLDSRRERSGVSVKRLPVVKDNCYSLDSFILDENTNTVTRVFSQEFSPIIRKDTMKFFIKSEHFRRGNYTAKIKGTYNKVTRKDECNSYRASGNILKREKIIVDEDLSAKITNEKYSILEIDLTNFFKTKTKMRKSDLMIYIYDENDEVINVDFIASGYAVKSIADCSL